MNSKKQFKEKITMQKMYKLRIFQNRNFAKK